MGFFPLSLPVTLCCMSIKNKNEWLNITVFLCYIIYIKVVFIRYTWHIYVRIYIYNTHHSIIHITYGERTNIYFEIKEKAEKVWFCKIIIILWKCVFGADFHSQKKKYEEIQLQEVQSYNNWHASVTAVVLLCCEFDFIPSAECIINFVFNSKWFCFKACIRKTIIKCVRQSNLS